jgi:hypothetical protein
LQAARSFAFTIAVADSYCYADTKPYIEPVVKPYAYTVFSITKSDSIQVHINLQRTPLSQDLMHHIFDQEVLIYHHFDQVIDYAMRWLSLQANDIMQNVYDTEGDSKDDNIV